MNPTAKCLKSPPEHKKSKDPVAEAICAYMKALDDQCREILEREGLSELSDQETDEYIMNQAKK